MPKSSEIEGLPAMTAEDEKLVAQIESVRGYPLIRRGSRGREINATLGNAASAISRLSTELQELRAALSDIASRNFVRLEKEEGRTLDETAAVRLYNEWHAILEIARAALKPETVK